jgi:hypothetical protein
MLLRCREANFGGASNLPLVQKRCGRYVGGIIGVDQTSQHSPYIIAIACSLRSFSTRLTNAHQVQQHQSLSMSTRFSWSNEPVYWETGKQTQRSITSLNPRSLSVLQLDGRSAVRGRVCSVSLCLRLLRLLQSSTVVFPHPHLLCYSPADFISHEPAHPARPLAGTLRAALWPPGCVLARGRPAKKSLWNDRGCMHRYGVGCPAPLVTASSHTIAGRCSMAYQSQRHRIRGRELRPALDE